jgi:hypothetical protein
LNDGWELERLLARSESPSSATKAKKRFTLKGLLVAIAVVAGVMGFLRVRHLLRSEYSYSGTIEIKNDVQTYRAMLRENEELPWAYKKVDGVWISITGLMKEEGFTLAVEFEVTGNGFNHAEQLQKMKARMDLFVQQFPELEFGERRLFMDTGTRWEEIKAEQRN